MYNHCDPISAQIHRVLLYRSYVGYCCKTGILAVVHFVFVKSYLSDNYFWFLADRTNGRAYATVLRLSSVVCDVMYCG